MDPQRIVKSIIRVLLHKAGFEIKRASKRAADPYSLSLYASLYDAATLERKPFYNVGAGSFWHPYWTNIDYISDWYGSVQKSAIHHDLMSRDPLPIESNSAEIVYTSHTIEHIKEDAVLIFFREAFRTLKPRGVFRVTTGPDAETNYRAMINGDTHWFYWDDWYAESGSFEHVYHKPANSVPIEERWLAHVAAPLAPNDISPSEHKFNAVEIRRIIDELGLEKALDFFTSKCDFDSKRPGNHISWWTHTKVSNFLEDAGFSNIYRSGYGQSVSPILRNTEFFDSTHPQMSIYVEAIK